MRRIACFTALAVAVAGIAGGDFVDSTRVAYFYDLNRYVLVAPYSPRCFLQLRAFEHDRVLDDVVLSSRYMEPVHEFKDVVLDDSPELLVKVRDGGTGLATTRLLVYLVTETNLAQIAEFPLARRCLTHGKPGTRPREEHLDGTVKFGTNNLTYAYTREIVDGATTNTSTGIDLYRFDDKNLKYVKGNPQQSVAPATSKPAAFQATASEAGER